MRTKATRASRIWLLPKHADSESAVWHSRTTLSTFLTFVRLSFCHIAATVSRQQQDDGSLAFVFQKAAPDTDPKLQWPPQQTFPC